MTNWHYTENGQQRGPISTDGLKGKIVTGELTGTSLVWQVGTKDWSEVRNFYELVGEVQTPPPLPKSIAVVAGTKTALTAFIDSLPVLIPLLSILLMAVALVLPMEASPRYKEYKIGEWFGIASVAFVAVAIALAFLFQPKSNVCSPSFAWKRCFAKILDWGLATLAGSIAVAFLGPTTWQSLLFAFVGVYLATWFLFEVPMKCHSLGRRVFGVRVQGATSANYFLRFVKLNIFGMGLWIPVLSYFAHLLAYKRLRETGTTIWDGNGFTVVDERAGVGRLVFGVLLIGTLLSVQGAVLKSAGKAAEISRSGESQSAPLAAPPAPVSVQPEALASPQRVVPKPTPEKPKIATYSFDANGHTYSFDAQAGLTNEQIQGLAPTVIRQAEVQQARANRAATSPGKQSLWAALTAQQREVLAPLSGEWDKLDAYRRGKWLDIAERYPSFSAEEQTRVHQRMANWASMTPEERERAREQYKTQNYSPPK